MANIDFDKITPGVALQRFYMVFKNGDSLEIICKLPLDLVGLARVKGIRPIYLELKNRSYETMEIDLCPLNVVHPDRSSLKIGDHVCTSEKEFNIFNSQVHDIKLYTKLNGVLMEWSFDNSVVFNKADVIMHYWSDGAYW